MFGGGGEGEGNPLGGGGGLLPFLHSRSTVSGRVRPSQSRLRVVDTLEWLLIPHNQSDLPRRRPASGLLHLWEKRDFRLFFLFLRREFGGRQCDLLRMTCQGQTFVDDVCPLRTLIRKSFKDNVDCIFKYHNHMKQLKVENSTSVNQNQTCNWYTGILQSLTGWGTTNLSDYGFNCNCSPGFRI